MEIVYRFDPCAPIDHEFVRSNEQALKRMEAGNDRFSLMVERMQSAANGEWVPSPWVINVNPITLGVPIVSGLAPAHAPFALVLGCADARVPIEHILDCSANDLFVVRVAGNVLGLECLGSIDYAASNLRDSLKSVVVLAHTQCGAVTAAVDMYLSRDGFGNIRVSHAVRSLVDRILLSVRGSSQAIERHLGRGAHSHPLYRKLLLSTSVFMNAAVTAWDLQKEVDAVTSGLPVSYTIYDVAHAKIAALPVIPGNTDQVPPRFAAAPASVDDFAKLAESVIARLIDSHEQGHTSHETL